MRSIYSKIRRSILFIGISWLIIPMELSASHTIGGELTYICTGVNQFEVTYKFYRDCTGISAPLDVTLISTSSCYPSLSLILDPTAWSPLPVTTTCPSASTSCNGGIYAGIELWVYTGIVTLPGLCTDWRLGVSVCCRNVAITTSDTASSSNIYTECLLNNQDAICNNSPVFTDDPYPFGCVGQKSCFSNEAYDSDGDSLVYQLIEPMTSSTLTLLYNPPYSGTQPILSSPPAQMNSLTGEFCMYPTQPDVSVYAALVSEYRNGVLIGQIERDIQFRIINCSNTPPTLSGLNGTSGFDATLCVGTSYDFSIYSSDPDIGQNTNIQWNWGINTASFVSYGSARDSAHFLWTPTLSDVSTNPHCFMAKVSDDNCPYFANGSAYYCFTVIDSSTILCGNVSVTEENIPSFVRVSSNRGLSIYTLEWNSLAGFTSLQLFDASGRILLDENVSSNTVTSINLANLSSGIYYVCLRGKDYWSKSLVRH